MMNDLISRKAIMDEAKRISGPMTGDGWDNWGVYALIERQPSVDAAPIIHGKWVKETDRFYHWHWRDAQDGEGGQAHVEHFVLFRHARTEPVKSLFQKVRIGVFDDARTVFHKEDGEHARSHGDSAQNHEEQPIA